MIDEINNRTTAVFLHIMLVVVWAIWAPVGLFLWIPLLFRATLLFAGLVVHAVVTGENPHGLRTNLEAAIDFWFYGFRISRATVLQPDQNAKRAVEPRRAHLVLLEIMWATGVWLVGAWIFTPRLLHSIFEVLNRYLRGLHELWLLMGLSIAFIFFILGRLFERGRADSNRDTSPGETASPSGPAT